MYYQININQKAALQYELNLPQAALMDLFERLSSWANEHSFTDGVYYSIAISKIIDELPLFFKKEDTVVRHIKILKEKALIEQHKLGTQQLNFIRLTKEGRLYTRVGKKSEAEQGSEKNPSRVGKKSEPLKQPQSPVIASKLLQGSEKNPNILDIIFTKDNTRVYGAYSKMLKMKPDAMQSFEMQRKKYINGFDDFLVYFNNTVEIEGLVHEWTPLWHRLQKLADNWKNDKSSKRRDHNTSIPLTHPSLKKIS